jgi:hypothetical protein
MKTMTKFVYFAFASLAFACFGFPPTAHAVSPAPDGGYPGGNTAEGQAALLSLTTGGFNTAVGFLSLRSNTTNSLNTAIGAGALLANTADRNTATGAGALLSDTTGAFNTANGAFALSGNSTGTFNTAIGAEALQNNTTGLSNTAIGFGAGFHATTGNGNVYIGDVEGVAGESNNTYIANINTTTVNGGGTDSVTVNLSTGLLGHLSSSRRYKEQIKPMNKASEALFALKPVSYRFKKEIDQSQGLDYGLIAEEVAEVDPNLAIRDGKGQIEGVRYNAINAMLLNEFLKEHRTVEELQATVAQQRKDSEATAARQQKEIEVLTASLKEQASQIQKVSAQLEVSKPAPQTVLNNQ